MTPLRRDRHGNAPLLLAIVVAAVIIIIAAATLTLGFSTGSFVPSGCSARGRVLDGDGNAIQGAKVEVRTMHFPSGPESPYFLVSDSVGTGVSGDFRVSVPCPSSSRLHVQADGFSARSVQLPANVDSGSWVYDFMLLRTAGG